MTGMPPQQSRRLFQLRPSMRSLIEVCRINPMTEAGSTALARDVADAAKDVGEKVERAQVQIDQPIKTLGLFPVAIVTTLFVRRVNALFERHMTADATAR